MTTDELFEAFGGRDEMARITGAGRNAVNNWRHCGIPYRHWRLLLQEAERRGLAAVTFDALHQSRLLFEKGQRA